jgi:hypothetical protein
MTSLPVDHVVLGSDDLDATAARLERDHGLNSVEGNRFDSAPGWGNRLVPLGETYIELFGVLEPEEVQDRGLLDVFKNLVEPADRWLGWALHPPDLDAVAERIGHAPARHAATFRSDGDRFEWSLLAFEERLGEPHLPFFLCWDDLDRHAAKISSLTSAAGNDPATITVELTGDPNRLTAWLGDLDPPHRLEPGASAMTGITVEAAAGTLHLA